MEDLSLDNILSEDDIDSLFDDGLQDTPPEQKETESEDSEVTEEKEETTEVNPDNLFEGGSESVGSEENNEDEEDADSDKDGSSPKFYSSIAKAFAEEGIFPDLDTEEIDKVQTPEDFKELIEKQIQSSLNEKQRRIDEALGVGVEQDVIKQYETTLNYLDSITAEHIDDESEKGEELRKRLIYQDFINRGYSKERANREVQKSLNAGTDIDDAKEALNSNKEFFEGQYNDLIKEAKEEQQKLIEDRKKQAEELKNSILSDKKVFGELEVDKATRQRIFDNIAKPVYKDPNTGQVLTAIQKYEMENRTEFLKNLGLVYTLTNGFKNLDGLVKNKVKKEVKKGFKELESTLNNTSRTSSGNLKYTSGVSDSESYLKGWELDA